MKKRYIYTGIICSCLVVSVYALSKPFEFDSSKLSFSTNSKKSIVVDSFDKKYNLSYSISNEDSELESKIKTLTKKTTYLLLGDVNNKNESYEHYYKRRQDYLDMRYNPEVPKDDKSFTGLDESSQEYKDDLVSGISVPSIFNQINELDIIYSSYGDIRITNSDNFIVSSITLPNVKMKDQDKDNPNKYVYTTTNLSLYYYFKELKGEYKLYYLFGETADNVSNYFTELENSEIKKTMGIESSYQSDLSSVYSFDKVNNLSSESITNLYDSNINNMVYLSSHYNNRVITSANGFFINDGILLTSWQFLEKSLINSQYITLTDSNGNNYDFDGIITASPETNIAVLKLKNKSNTYIKLGDSSKLKTEDPVITISSKSGVGTTLQKGIIIANDDYIQTSIPISITDAGSPIFDKDGNVIGMNTAKSTNTSISVAINSKVLKEVQDKFNNVDFSSIKTISFDKLKENYYYIKFAKESLLNNIPKNKWKSFSKIGNINDTIKMELVKGSYKDNIVSLRYKNNISEYISSMQLSSSFREELKKSGYEEILNSDKKIVYKNSKYQIIIMDEFDYLIIVMVKL